MLPRDAFFAPKETVPVGQAVGRICVEQITPYPPGMPVIIPGSASPPSSWTTCAAASARACSSPTPLIPPSTRSVWSAGVDRDIRHRDRPCALVLWPGRPRHLRNRTGSTNSTRRPARVAGRRCRAKLRVSLRVPSAAPRSTAALTRAKMAPCRAAASRTSRHPRCASVPSVPQRRDRHARFCVPRTVRVTSAVMVLFSCSR